MPRNSGWERSRLRGTPMSGRFSRSLELAKASFAVVRADKELLLLPVMSVFELIVIVLSLAVPVAVLGGFSTEAAQSEPLAMAGGAGAWRPRADRRRGSGSSSWRAGRRRAAGWS